MKPNPNVRSFVIGGHLSEIPKPHVRMYPKFKKRPVKIGVMKYWGLGRHYYASVTEAKNRIWNSKRECWQEAWDDLDGRGRSFNKRCHSLSEAKSWVQEILKKHFSGKNFAIQHDWNNLTEDQQKHWFGNYRQGD